jgi:hypothetical protein
MASAERSSIVADIFGISTFYRRLDHVVKFDLRHHFPEFDQRLGRCPLQRQQLVHLSTYCGLGRLLMAPRIGLPRATTSRVRSVISVGVVIVAITSCASQSLTTGPAAPAPATTTLEPGPPLGLTIDWNHLFPTSHPADSVEGISLAKGLAIRQLPGHIPEGIEVGEESAAGNVAIHYVVAGPASTQFDVYVVEQAADIPESVLDAMADDRVKAGNYVIDIVDGHHVLINTGESVARARAITADGVMLDVTGPKTPKDVVLQVVTDLLTAK